MLVYTYSTNQLFCDKQKSLQRFVWYVLLFYQMFYFILLIILHLQVILHFVTVNSILDVRIMTIVAILFIIY